MKNAKSKDESKVRNRIHYFLFYNGFVCHGRETIMKTISFEKCLKVIKTSENKLSIAPEIKDMTDKKRVAIFTLADGTLTIECDGIASKVIVLTNKN